MLECWRHSSLQYSSLPHFLFSAIPLYGKEENKTNCIDVFGAGNIKRMSFDNVDENSQLPVKPSAVVLKAWLGLAIGGSLLRDSWSLPGGREMRGGAHGFFWCYGCPSLKPPPCHKTALVGSRWLAGWLLGFYSAWSQGIWAKQQTPGCHVTLRNQSLCTFSFIHTHTPPGSTSFSSAQFLPIYLRFPFWLLVRLGSVVCKEPSTIFPRRWLL